MKICRVYDMPRVYDKYAINACEHIGDRHMGIVHARFL